MKNPQQLKRQAQIKQKLKDYYRYFESDFYTDGEDIYMNCQDNVGISVKDMWENLELERKENYVIGYDPYEQDNESSSYGATYKVKPDGTFELIKYEE